MVKYARAQDISFKTGTHVSMYVYVSIWTYCSISISAFGFSAMRRFDWSHFNTFVEFFNGVYWYFHVHTLLSLRKCVKFHVHTYVQIHVICVFIYAFVRHFGYGLNLYYSYGSFYGSFWFYLSFVVGFVVFRVCVTW